MKSERCVSQKEKRSTQEHQSTRAMKEIPPHSLSVHNWYICDIRHPDGCPYCKRGSKVVHDLLLEERNDE